MACKKKSSVRKPARRQFTGEFKEGAVQLLTSFWQNLPSLMVGRSGRPLCV